MLPAFEEAGSLYRYFLYADLLFEASGGYRPRQGVAGRKLRSNHNRRQDPGVSEDDAVAMAIVQDSYLYPWITYASMFVVIDGYRPKRRYRRSSWPDRTLKGRAFTVA